MDLKCNGITLNGEPVVIRERHIFYVAGSVGALVETIMVILSGIFSGGCGIQANKRGIRYSHLIEFLDLVLHNLFY